MEREHDQDGFGCGYAVLVYVMFVRVRRLGGGVARGLVVASREMLARVCRVRTMILGTRGEHALCESGDVTKMPQRATQ